MNKADDFNKLLDGYINTQKFSSDALDKADDDIYQFILSAMVI